MVLQVVPAEIVFAFPGDVEVDQLIHVPLVETGDFIVRIADDLMRLEILTAHEQSVFQEQYRDETGFNTHGGQIPDG